MTEHTDGTVQHEPSARSIYTLFGLLAASIVLMYLGRSVLLYHGAFLSGGFGGIAVMLGGGSAEQGQQVYDAVQRTPPGPWEQVSWYSGMLLLFAQAAYIRWGDIRD